MATQLRILDPIRGELLGEHAAYEPMYGLYRHDFTACPRRRERGPATDTRLLRLLLEYTGSAATDRVFKREFWQRFGKDPRTCKGRSATVRVELARKIEDAFRRGAVWPHLGEYGPYRPAALGQRRRETNRPDSKVCLRWDGMLWMPCASILERRAAGFMPLMMCWPPPLPKAGDFLSSGDRARFIYRICEVERFRPPRGARRYTCRLWCERVLPEDVPKRAVHHQFYWHPRKRRAA